MRLSRSIHAAATLAATLTLVVTACDGGGTAPVATPTAPIVAPTPTAVAEASIATPPIATPTATVEPTATATVEPTATATVEPTATATVEPTATATVAPTATATVAPTPTPTVAPTPTPTVAPTPTPTPVPTKVPVIEPRYGGTVTLGSLTTNSATGRIPPFQVRTSVETSSIAVSNNVYNNLMIKDPFADPPHTTVEGHLVVEWNVSGDGTTITLKLREGVTWHDGADFSSEDVVHTVDAMVHPPQLWRSDFLGPLSTRLANTEAVDDRTVVFTTHRPSAYFFDLLTDARFQIIPAHIPDLEQLAANPVGTGPWMHDSTTVDVETVLVKNPNYFRTDPEGRMLPFLDGLIWMQFTAFDLWLAALKTGRTQMVDHFHGAYLDPSEVREDLEQSVPGIVFDYYIVAQFGVIFGARPPFDDPRVREAVFLWLDRKQVLESDSGGQGSVYGSGVIPTDLGGRWGLPEQEIYDWPGLRYVDASGKTVLSSDEFQAKRGELEKHPDDLARAKELLAEAGIAPGSVKRTILVQGGGVQDRVGPIVVRQLSELFDAEWEIRVSTDAATFWTQHIFSGNWEGIAWGNHGNMGPDDPHSMTEDGGWVSTSFWYGGEEGFIPWSGHDPNPRIDSLYAEQDAVVGDDVRRRELIHSLQREVLRHHIRIIGHLPKSPGAHHPEIMGRPAGGDVPGTTNRTNNWMYDRMWLDI